MDKSESIKQHTLRFRAADEDTFEAIRDGRKKVETRAATEKYRDIKKGDIVTFICGSKKFQRTVTKAEHFSSIGAILKKYKPAQIVPGCKSAQEMRKIWYSFPNYKEKIHKYGLIALKLT